MFFKHLHRNLLTLSIIEQKFPDDITWSLHIWQTMMYSKNQRDVPAAGYLLVDELSKLIADNGTNLGESIPEKLLRTNFKREKPVQQKKLLKQQFASLGNAPEKRIKSHRNYQFQVMLKDTQEKYAKITNMIEGLLRNERNEMLSYMERNEQILMQQKQCKEDAVWKGKLEGIEKVQRQQLEDLRQFMSKVLKYQDVAKCELWLNVEKLEQGLELIKREDDSRGIAYNYYRLQRVTEFQVKIIEHLEMLEEHMKTLIRYGCGIQSKLNSLSTEVMLFQHSLE